MPRTESNTYDAIIIGAGISGLVCGCYLAKAGMKIVVLEQHDKPGGYFTSFRRKNFLFDAAAHSFGNYRDGGHVRKIFTELGVSEQTTIKRYDPSDIIMTPQFRITFGGDAQATIKSIADEFPSEKDNAARFFNFLTSAGPEDFVKLKDKTFAYLLHSFFKSKELMNALAFPVFGNGGLPPSMMHAFSGSKIFSEFLIDGGYYPEGGIQMIPDSLAGIIKMNGSILKYRTLVKRILNVNGSVRGVELDNGEHLFSRYVVSAGDLTEAYTALLGRECVPAEQLSRLAAMVPSLSTFICYMGMDGAVDVLPQGGTNVWHLGGYDLDAIYENIGKCIFNAPSAFMLRASPDKKMLLAFMTAPFADRHFWERNKRRIADAFVESIEEHIPGLRRHIAYFDAASPVTLQRYTRNYQAAAFGWAKMPEQMPDIFACKKSPLRDLYFTGHWTSIGFGMPGTCYSGYETARRILRTHDTSTD